jgi:hypothetical protein
MATHDDDDASEAPSVPSAAEARAAERLNLERLMNVIAARLRELDLAD